ncbi:MAG: CheR family methyltransferase [Bacteroidota bacterium]
MYQTISENQRHEFIAKLQPVLPEIQYYLPSFLDRRIRFVMNKMGFADWHSFISYLDNNHSYDALFSFLMVPATEFFRDSLVWHTLFHTIIPKLIKNDPCNIWFPDCSSGHELYSLCMLLDILNVRNQVHIYAGCKSQQIIDKIQTGVYSAQCESMLVANYKNTEIPYDISKYYTINYHSLICNPELVSHVNFIHSSSLLEQEVTHISLIMYRNSLLYYTRDSQHTFITSMYKKMNFGAYLLLGIKEGENIFGLPALFSTYNKDLGLYRKK